MRQISAVGTKLSHSGPARAPVHSFHNCDSGFFGSPQLRVRKHGEGLTHVVLTMSDHSKFTPMYYIKAAAAGGICKLSFLPVLRPRRRRFGSSVARVPLAALLWTQCTCSANCDCASVARV